MAGFNEVDIYLQYSLHGARIAPPAVKYGYYLRSLCEVFITREKVL